MCSPSFRVINSGVRSSDLTNSSLGPSVQKQLNLFDESKKDIEKGVVIFTLFLLLNSFSI